MRHQTVGSNQGQAGANPVDRVLLLARDDQVGEQVAELLRLWKIDHVACQSVARAFSTLVEAASGGTPFTSIIVEADSLTINPLEFARALREEDLLEACSLIYLTPPLTESRQREMLAGGFSRVVNIPLENRVLFNALQESRSVAEGADAVVNLLSRHEEPRQVSRLEILIGDSDLINQQRMTRLLQRSGHQVFLIEEGSEALDALDAHAFDLVILSSELPGISGLEAFKLYGFARPGEERPPFILLIDEGASETLSACIAAGADACLEAPVSDEQLMETLVGLAGKHFGDAASGTERGLSPPSRNALLDYKRLSELQEFGTGEAFLRQLIVDFDETITRLIDQMERAIIDQDLKAFREQGQSLKENAGNLGALSLYRLGGRAVSVDDEVFKVEAPRLVVDLRNEHRAVRMGLKEFLAGPALLSPRGER